MTDSKRVGYSNRLDLDWFFFEAKDQIYAVVKLQDEFPNYYEYSDVDVFCYNKDEFARAVLRVGNWYLGQGFEIKISDTAESHTYVDFHFDGRLDFRFDLYQSLPDYQKIRLKESYILSVVENATVLDREFDGIPYPFYVASPTDDLLLRYVEYIEHYELRPDKVKHLDHIVATLASDSSRIGFVDKLHVYTELPFPNHDGTASHCVSQFGRARSWARRIPMIPPRRIPGALLRRLRRIFSALLTNLV